MKFVHELYDSYYQGSLCPAFAQICDGVKTGLLTNQSISAQTLNKCLPTNTNYTFCPQEDLTDSMTYEEFILKNKQIPTRNDSWHDYFNACIWRQFPVTKSTLNKMHVEQIPENWSKSKRCSTR